MNLSLKIKIILCLCVLMGNSSVYASSFSSNFSVNDESLDFAHNTDYLESLSFTMDLSGVFWTDRPSESASFTIIDANSDLVAVTPPPPPPPPPGGGGGPIAGGRPDVDLGETDVAVIGALPEEEQGPDLDLHESAEEEVEKPFVPYVPAPVPEPVQIGLVYDDFDGCSAQFEMKYMQSNPYKNDTDDDGVEDCDEDWVYDTNPIVKNDNFIHVGIAQAEEFVYTQLNPLFVGRADFGLDESYTENYVQLGIELVDPDTEIGMFFLELKDDMNCIGLSEIDLESGNYKAVLYRDGEKQESPNDVYIDLEQEYEDLLISVPEGGMLNYDDRFVFVGGSTGADYGVVALWANDEFVDVSAVVADYKGDYYLSSPKQLEDGEYLIYLYGIFEEDDRLIQTNYHVLKIKMEEGVPYIVEKVEEKETPKWKTALDYAKTQIDEQKVMHASANESDPMYLLSYGIFLMIVIISYFVVWLKEN